MRAKGHARLFAIGTTVWAGFWVVGLPSYYQQYSSTTMALFDVILLFVLVWVLLPVLGKIPRERRMGVSVWMAFYFTLPFAFYDWLYCGIFLGHGMSFLWRYWYLTAYYFLPWVVLPGIAQWLARMQEIKHHAPE